ncbi:MAG: hypothetical protein E6K56_08010 [Ignavibacteria bacterium]|nr:MAG: hypothetical protein E6K56_08010 [Ignavibacteria bacterium]
MPDEVHAHLNQVLDPPASTEGRIRRENQRPWSRNLLHSFRDLLDHLRDLAVASIPAHDDRKIMLDAYLTGCALSCTGDYCALSSE